MKKMMKKQGFTLIELMVVVIIVGILAAVAVPLMSSNRERAISSEAIAAIGAINTSIRVAQAEGVLVDQSNYTDYFSNETDLDGTYFNNAGYSVTTVAVDAQGVNRVTEADVEDSNGNKTYTFTWVDATKSYTVVTQ